MRRQQYSLLRAPIASAVCLLMVVGAFGLGATAADARWIILPAPLLINDQRLVEINTKDYYFQQLRHLARQYVESGHPDVARQISFAVYKGDFKRITGQIVFTPPIRIGRELCPPLFLWGLNKAGTELLLDTVRKQSPHNLEAIAALNERLIQLRQAESDPAMERMQNENDLLQYEGALIEVGWQNQAELTKEFENQINARASFLQTAAFERQLDELFATLPRVEGYPPASAPE